VIADTAAAQLQERRERAELIDGLRGKVNSLALAFDQRCGLRRPGCVSATTRRAAHAATTQAQGCAHHHALCVLRVRLRACVCRTAQLRSAQDVGKLSLSLLSVSKALEEGRPVGQQLQVACVCVRVCVCVGGCDRVGSAPSKHARTCTARARRT
jgi:hypothetical protein